MSLSRLTLGFLAFSFVAACALGADDFDVRALAEAPQEADHEGFAVRLVDTHTPELLVAGEAVVPESFGAITSALLRVRNGDGELLCVTAPSARPLPEKGGVAFGFHLRDELLQRSVLSVTTPSDRGGVQVATIALGTFAKKELPPPVESDATPALPISEFGTLEASDWNQFTSAEFVPRREGQVYGFRLYFRGDGRSLPVRVELELPEKPATWGDAAAQGEVTISTDGRTEIRSMTIPTGTLFEHGWAVADGDPVGEHQVRIFVGETLVKKFVFTVSSP